LRLATSTSSLVARWNAHGLSPWALVLVSFADARGALAQTSSRIASHLLIDASSTRSSGKRRAAHRAAELYLCDRVS